MPVTPGAAVWPMSSPPMEGGVLAGTSLPQAQLDSRGAGMAWGRTAFGRVLDRGVSSMVPHHCFCPLDVILYGVRCKLPETTLMVSQQLQQRHISGIKALPCVCLSVGVNT